MLQVYKQPQLLGAFHLFWDCELLCSPGSDPTTQAILPSPTKKCISKSIYKIIYLIKLGVRRTENQYSSRTIITIPIVFCKHWRGIDLHHSFQQKQIPRQGRFPCTKLFCSFSSPPAPSPSHPAPKNTKTDGEEYLDLPMVYCFWKSSGIRRGKDAPLPCPRYTLSADPTSFLGVDDKSPFGV